MSVLKQFEHLKIKLEAIESATNNFAEDSCIGKGGFGKVYKGDLLHSNGLTTVAIKRLDRAFGQGDSEFWKEVIMLSVYSHENIVSLLGFCDEREEKILVYEYASRRSLDLHLDNKDLTWVRRLQICIGAARGLAYLHNPAGTQQRVLHRDIKSSNILLDENWNARIADLGLSKFGPANQIFTFIVTNNRVGTIGYCDPLYLECGILTKESDVYSFGVVLFEVLCGRLCFGRNDNKPQSFTQLVRKHYKHDSLYEIIWGNIKDEIHPSSLEVFSTVAYQCLKKDSEKRPLMEDVLTELEIALEYQVDNNVGGGGELGEGEVGTGDGGGGGGALMIWQNARQKAEVLSHPLYELLLAAHVACLRSATPVDQLPRIDAQLAQSQQVVSKYSALGGHGNLVHDDKELDQFMTHYVLLLCSFKAQLQQHVRVHAVEAIMACWEIEQSLQSLTGVSPGEGTGATMSDDDEDQVDSDANLFDGSLDGHDSMGFGLPTESERSLMERVRQELKHELKQGYGNG